MALAIHYFAWKWNRRCVAELLALFCCFFFHELIFFLHSPFLPLFSVGFSIIKIQREKSCIIFFSDFFFIFAVHSHSQMEYLVQLPYSLQMRETQTKRCFDDRKKKKKKLRNKIDKTALWASSE